MAASDSPKIVFEDDAQVQAPQAVRRRPVEVRRHDPIYGLLAAGSFDDLPRRHEELVLHSGAGTQTRVDPQMIWWRPQQGHLISTVWPGQARVLRRVREEDGRSTRRKSSSGRGWCILC